MTDRPGWTDLELWLLKQQAVTGEAFELVKAFLKENLK